MDPELKKDRLFQGGKNKIVYKNLNLYWDKFHVDAFKKQEKINISYDLIKTKLLSQDNIINHPCVCFTKRFWNSTDFYGNILRYRNDKPYEDVSLWTRAVNNNIPISIVNEYLINYRIHGNQIGELKKKSESGNNKLDTFGEGPNLSKMLVGLVVTNLETISQIESSILPNYPKFYFIVPSLNLEEQTNLKNKIINSLKEKQIDNYVIFPKTEQLNYHNLEKYLTNYETLIQLHSNYLIYSQDYYQIKIQNLSELPKLEEKNSDKIFVKKSVKI